MDWAVNHRRTGVSKRKQSRGLLELVGVIKWYMQISREGFELVGGSVSQSQFAIIESASGWVNPGRETEEVQSGVLKITQCAMAKRRSYGSI